MSSKISFAKKHKLKLEKEKQKKIGVSTSDTPSPALRAATPLPEITTILPSSPASKRQKVAETTKKTTETTENQLIPLAFEKEVPIKSALEKRMHKRNSMT